ncbi:ROK family protein [Catenulispora acidiphila DSM 44928]|uniref:ROK family protein n=1 Tax=Catenulispora acidiphila (strain DSM 44928 / JCM 14897 / NBRC 102108 / NRRL B-24433 / ID139908) TaxID=479433 RepID=C7QFW1_CATAD|nr:ROK family transcriptional regulator [Catenulispora acidiphila]ACU70938.1 ROK family protein [Catenulispora acidiphila DSM 44928]
MSIREGRPASGVTAATLREMNIRTVWSVIEGGHPISRAEIARLTGISKPTVSVLLEELLATGLVTQSPDTARDPAHGAVFFGPKPDGVHALALDLGAHMLRGVLAGPGAVIAARQDVDVNGMDAPLMVAAAARLAEELIAAAGVDAATVRHAVAGVPGVVDRHTGRVWQALNIPALNGFAIAKELQTAVGVPFTVENDIDLAALGENTHGTGAAAESFAFLSVGTGVGAGLVLHGHLHRGHSGAAGELDTAFDAEAFVANDPCAAAIVEYATPYAAELTTNAAPLTTELIFDQARAGHPRATEIVDEVARRISAYIGVLAAVADVELVILGGGIGLNGDLLLERVSLRLQERLPYPPRLEVSALGDSAVLTGAAAVAAAVAVEQVIRERTG